MASSNYKNFIRIPKRKKGLHTSSETDLSKSKLSTLERIVLSKTKVYTHQSSNSSYIQNTTFRSPQNYHSASSNNLDNLSTIKLSNLLPTLDDTLRYPSNLKKIPPVIPNEEVSDISSDNYIHLNEFDHRRAKTLMDNRRIGYQNPSFYCEFSINRDPLSSIELNQFASHDSSNLVQKNYSKS
ncbi:hypothetical protein TBLA_0E02700 [Henningerozyma blattae CBS 6284]|uniref:Uncharacterized protein n=1 Tax=Henningerozyma blattae (strain ATCC 34711 / CBS 6284 / DSM 70876 / NBRC 10599 / NRRL Y-10934 / UCD 77-7) TaxID=1071380 RepID=I2H4M4_HENB6|nr:hypothetical protein TBLA_0E02700 [Tetrapisispora blattae CBS 6284]CCH61326.1 hypothetical protein TBLA_0E02700 [Tetrapisispora blattae CBS 6284]